MSGFWTCHECGAEMYGFENCQFCGAHKGGGEAMSESNYEKLFGAPERAARTLEEFELDQLNWCRGTEYCESCPYEFDRYGCYLPDGFELLEWLRGDAE